MVNFDRYYEPPEQDLTCAVCGQYDECVCPECSVCGGQGDPECYPAHGLVRSVQQIQSWAEYQKALAADIAADNALWGEVLG